MVYEEVQCALVLYVVVLQGLPILQKAATKHQGLREHWYTCAGTSNTLYFEILQALCK